MCLLSHCWWVGDNPKNGPDIYTGLTVVFSHHNVTCITSADLPSVSKLTPKTHSHNPFTPMSHQRQNALPLYNCPKSMFLFQILDILGPHLNWLNWYLVQQWLKRCSSTLRKFTVTRHQDWAPEETIHASGICVPLIDAYNNYSPHYYHHRMNARIYRCCIAPAAQSQSYSTLVRWNTWSHNTYLTFHNSHNSHPYIQHIYHSGIAPHMSISKNHLIFHTPSLTSLHQGDAGRKIRIKSLKTTFKFIIKAMAVQ